MKEKFIATWFQYHMTALFIGIATGMAAYSLLNGETGAGSSNSEAGDLTPYVIAVIIDIPISLGLCYFFFYKAHWLKKDESDGEL